MYNDENSELLFHQLSYCMICKTVTQRYTKQPMAVTELHREILLINAPLFTE